MVRVFTRSHGQVSLLAKGAYRMRSRYFGVLDLFDTLGLEWRASRAELGSLTGGEVLERRRALSADLDRYRAGLHVLELVALGTREAEPDPGLFQLTLDTLDALAQPDVEPELARLAFDLAFLAQLGLKPALEDCASCGRDLSRERAKLVPVSYRAGGRLCTDCATEEGGHRSPLARQALGNLKVAQSLMKTPIAALGRTRIAPASQEGLDRFVQGFAEYHLETQPRVRTVRRSTSPGPALPPTSTRASAS